MGIKTRATSFLVILHVIGTHIRQICIPLYHLIDTNNNQLSIARFRFLLSECTLLNLLKLPQLSMFRTTFVIESTGRTCILCMDEVKNEEVQEDYFPAVQ